LPAHVDVLVVDEQRRIAGDEPDRAVVGGVDSEVAGVSSSSYVAFETAKSVFCRSSARSFIPCCASLTRSKPLAATG